MSPQDWGYTESDEHDIRQESAELDRQDALLDAVLETDRTDVLDVCLDLAVEALSSIWMQMGDTWQGCVAGDALSKIRQLESNNTPDGTDFLRR